MPLADGNDLLLGRDESGGPIHLSHDQRARHMYVVGGTGMGKSKFLESMLRQDIDQWSKSRCGLLLLDPHGSLFDGVMNWLTSNRMVYRERPIIPIGLRTDDFVVGYNLLRPRDGEPSTVIDAVVEAMAYALGQDSAQETPTFRRLASAALHALYAEGLGLTDIFDIIAQPNKKLRASLIPTLPRAAAEGLAYLNTLSPTEYANKVESTLNRVHQFLSNPTMARMFGQTATSLDFRSALDEGAIVLVSLATSRNKASKQDAALLATVMLADLWTAAGERGKERTRGKGPKPFYVYMDEFQRFITPTIAENLDEARGYGLHLTLAHQFPRQLSGDGERGKRLFHSVMVNAQSKVVLGLEYREEIKPLAEWLFMGTIDPDQVKFDLKTRGVIAEHETTRLVESVSDTEMESDSAAESSSLSRTENESETSSEADSMAYRDYKPPEPTLMEMLFPTPIDPEADTGPNMWMQTLGSNTGASRGHGQSEGESSSRSRSSSRGASRSTSEVPFVEREWGEQLTSRQFRSVDEQFLIAQQRIFNLQRREAWIRLADSKLPQKMRTEDVPDEEVSPRNVATYRLRLLEQWDFVKTRDEAQASIDARAAQLAGGAKAPPVSEEPQAFSNRRSTKARDE